MAKPNLEEVLFKQGILVDLDIGRWTATKKLHKEDLHLPTIDPGAIHLGHKKLMPKSAIEKIKAIEGKARSTLASCSSDFPISGSRFVRYPVLEELLEKLTTLKIKYHEEVLALLENYPILRKAQLEVLNSQVDKIASSLIMSLGDNTEKLNEVVGWQKVQYLKNEQAFPNVEDLKSKFRFEWRLFKVTSADSLGSVSADQALEAHKKLQADLQEWVQETAILMHKTLGEAAKNAKELLEKQGKLNPKNLKPLFDAFESFKSIDISGSDLQKQLDDIKKQYAFMSDKDEIDYEKSAAGINNSPKSMEQLNGLLNALGKYAVDDIAKEAGDAVLSKVVTGYSRTIDLD